MADLTKRKALRLNVSCSTRDKKFLVLGETEDTVSQFFTVVKKMFRKLYPDEADLKICGVKNQQGFDIFTEYKLGDLFEDNACLSITEDLTSTGEDSENLNGSVVSSGFNEKEQVIECDGDATKKNETTDSPMNKNGTDEPITENITLSSKKSKADETTTENTSLSKKSKTEQVISKKKVDEEEKEKEKSPSRENKRSHSESAEDDQDKRKKRHNKNRKKKATK